MSETEVRDICTISVMYAVYLGMPNVLLFSQILRIVILLFFSHRGDDLFLLATYF